MDMDIVVGPTLVRAMHTERARWKSRTAKLPELSGQCQKREALKPRGTLEPEESESEPDPEPSSSSLSSSIFFCCCCCGALVAPLVAGVVVVVGPGFAADAAVAAPTLAVEAPARFAAVLAA
mmetsp:Transcript_25534/g.38814  ORF Transcript_25534/g.38814 Transcript_25534/m.38814 type:complete len:122 (-) Transcript_25534:107-472(-)